MNTANPVFKRIFSLLHQKKSFSLCLFRLGLIPALALAPLYAADPHPKYINVDSETTTIVDLVITPNPGDPCVIKTGGGTLLINGADMINNARLVIEEGVVKIDGSSWDGYSSYTYNGIQYMTGSNLGPYIGGPGNARLYIIEGAKVFNKDFSNIGTYKGDGEVVVSGAGTYWNNANCLFIGGNGFYHEGDLYMPPTQGTNGGSGKVTITDGAIVETGMDTPYNVLGRQVHVGHGSDGTLDVSGNGSQFISHGYISVGTFGAKSDTWKAANGTVNITDGANVTITNENNTDGEEGYLMIGYFAGATGAVNIDNASLDVKGGESYIGFGSTRSGYLNDQPAKATLNLDNSARMNIEKDIFMGYYETSEVIARVSNNSVLKTQGDLYVSAGGTTQDHEGKSNLTVESKAEVRAKNLYLGSGSTTTVLTNGKVMVGVANAATTPDSIHVNTGSKATIKGIVNIEASSEQRNGIYANGGTVEVDKAKKVKIRLFDRLMSAILANNGGKVRGDGLFDVEGRIMATDTGAINLTMTNGSEFTGYTVNTTTTGNFDLSLEGTIWNLTQTDMLGYVSTLNAFSATKSSVLAFTIDALLDYTSIQSDSAIIDASLIRVILNGYNPVAGDSFQLVDADSYDINGHSFDFSQAMLDPGLVWYTGDFATNGTISILEAIPEPSMACLCLLGMAAMIGRRRMQNVI